MVRVHCFAVVVDVSSSLYLVLFCCGRSRPLLSVSSSCAILFSSPLVLVSSALLYSPIVDVTRLLIVSSSRFTKAADAGDADAMGAIGGLYSNGQGVR